MQEYFKVVGVNCLPRMHVFSHSQLYVSAESRVYNPGNAHILPARDYKKAYNSVYHKALIAM